MGIARMIGVDKSMGDPNTFGGSIVYALPFVIPFWLSSPTKSMKWFLAAYLALSLVCIGLTGSRSSFVGLLLWAFLTVFRSRRRFSMAILAFLAAPLLWAALPPSMQNRFETIIHPEVGPANAVVSGQDRIEGFKIGMELWGQHPLIGVGPGAWRPATKRALESHNLYGQLLGEMGSLGGMSFLALLFCFWSNLRWIRKTYKQHPDWKPDFLYHVAGAAGVGVVLLLFEGNFGHNLFRYNWLWYGGYVIIARYCVEQRLSTSPAWSASVPTFSFGTRGWGMARSYSA
jgi:O-antigen ligase